MNESSLPHDDETAQADGEAFGRAIGGRAASDMMQAVLSGGDITTIGEEAIA